MVHRVMDLRLLGSSIGLNRLQHRVFNIRSGVRGVGSVKTWGLIHLSYGARPQAVTVQQTGAHD